MKTLFSKELGYRKEKRERRNKKNQEKLSRTFYGISAIQMCTYGYNSILSEPFYNFEYNKYLIFEFYY